MAISMRSILFIGGGLGLLYASSPRFRRAVQPSLRKASDSLTMLSVKRREATQRGDEWFDAFNEESRPKNAMEDLKELIQSMSLRLSKIEKSMGSAFGRTNEYASQHFTH